MRWLAGGCEHALFLNGALYKEPEIGPGGDVISTAAAMDCSINRERIGDHDRGRSAGVALV